MTRVLLDTNVVLDALLERAPWVVEARAIWEAHLRQPHRRRTSPPRP